VRCPFLPSIAWKRPLLSHTTRTDPAGEHALWLWLWAPPELISPLLNPKPQTLLNAVDILLHDFLSYRDGYHQTCLHRHELGAPPERMSPRLKPTDIVQYPVSGVCFLSRFLTPTVPLNPVFTGVAGRAAGAHLATAQRRGHRSVPGEPEPAAAAADDRDAEPRVPAQGHRVGDPRSRRHRAQVPRHRWIKKLVLWCL